MVATSTERLSFAKVNLHLQVVGRRADGYHELRTLFQSIDLCDRIAVSLTAAPGVALTVRGADLPADASNLAWRAAEGYLARWAPTRGVSIELDKRLPMGGGLGGGSANAATVLTALQDLLGQPAPAAELWRLARDLGADVPYFLLGGTVMSCGRGDELMPLPDLPSADLVLVVPPVAVSTREVFTASSPPVGASLAPAVQALAAGWRVPTALADLVADLDNDLAPGVFARYPAVAMAHQALLGAGATVARMSGSGATLFALFPAGRPSAAELSRLSAALPLGSRVERCRTLSRADFVARARVTPGPAAGDRALPT